MPAPDVSGYSPAETWYWTQVGGSQLALSQPYWNIATIGGSRFAVPTFRGQNYETPYRSGQSWRAKYPDSRTVTLNMWTDGLASAGQAYPSSDARLAFNDNLQQLRAAFFSMGANGSQQGQLQRNWYLTVSGVPTLVASTAMAELAGSMDLTPNGRTNAAFSVDFLLSDPAFYGAVQSVACTGASTSITGLGEMVVGLGYPSAVASFSVQLSAAATVTNTTAGCSLTFAGAASYPVTVDVLNGTVTDNAGANWISGLTHSGARAWMAILPGSNTIDVSAGTATFHWTDAYI